MNFETSYPVTEQLQLEASKQMFMSVYLKMKWIVILGLWIISGISLFWVNEMGWLFAGFLLASAFILTVLWVKAYLRLRENARNYLKTMDDPMVTLKISLEELEISSSTGSKRIAWSKVNRVAETKDFVIPMIGKLPMLCVPKERLTGEVLDMIRQRWVS